MRHRSKIDPCDAEGIVVLVSDDGQLLGLVAAELREMGCQVFCARDVEQASRLARAGLARRFVVVRLTDAHEHAPEPEAARPN